MVLRRLAVVPALTAGVSAQLVLSFAILSCINSDPVVPWLGKALWAGSIAAIVLGWFAIQMRRGSIRMIGSAATTFSFGVLFLVVWRSRAGGPAVEVVLTSFVPAILAVSGWWALLVARRLHSGFPEYHARPHATRRLSLPRDVRALRALVPALLGGLQALLALVVALGLAPFLRHQALALSVSLFMPIAFRHFRRVRAVLALRAQEVRLADQRSPVLLLRSFADDELVMPRTTALSGSIIYIQRSLEEQIVAQLWEVGPVVAIGQPALETDPIGAARERIVGPLWQPRVQALIEESALVVVVLGQTEGLFWEYEQLSRRCASVLAILPPGYADTLAARWERFAAAYPAAVNVDIEAASELPLLVWFCADHEPLIVSGQPRDERSYELAFAFWCQNRSD
jgi:hypothetical protein